MKPATLISLLALVLSVIALCLALEERSGKIPQSQIDEQVDMALAIKERELVEKLSPRLEGLYSDMLEDSEYKKNPETLADVFGPLVTIFEHMVGS